jgi:hypothetical protein
VLEAFIKTDDKKSAKYAVLVSNYN